MRILLLAAIALAGCGVKHGGASAPLLNSNGDLIVRGTGLTIIVPPNTSIHDIDITGDHNAVTVGTSSSVSHGVLFHGSLSEVHLPVSLEFSLWIHQDSGDGNKVYYDSSNN